VVRRAEALADAISNGLVVGVSGTHGKTTTTVMITDALAAAGRHPTGIAGGRVSAWSGNARLGGDDLFVVEADEYDKSFLAITPQVAVVNNVEADHLECYGSVEALEEAYASFARPARRIVSGADDPGAERVVKLASRPTWRVGTGPGADVRIMVKRRDVAASVADVALPSGQTARLRLVVPGLHNLTNAAVALAVCEELGADLGEALQALGRFSGVGRRFELVGEESGVVVVDDYAHHEAEIAATLEAARQAYPGRRLVAAFQPHLYSRTRDHGEAMGTALAAADVAVVTEVYAAREQPIAGVSGRMVLDAARRTGARAEWVEALSGMAGCLANLAREGDVVVTMGAGDITRVGPELLRLLAGPVPAE
jgi:UDP-N-acetylmuramate--alanine ligase